MERSRGRNDEWSKQTSMAAPSPTTTVLITGASGYLGSWLVAVVLAQTDWNVRATCRGTAQTAKVGHLHRLPGAAGRLELVELDLLSSPDDAFDDALRGVRIVMHSASPFPSKPPKHEDDLIRPAVEGTLRVLRAADKSDSVARVVLTSSTTAVGNTEVGDGVTLNESNWTDVSKVHAYEKSKTLAERAAWDFHHNQRVHNKSYSMCAINPGFIMGPCLNVATIGSSMEMGFLVMNGFLPVLPQLWMPLCDVRDCAQAHLKAAQLPVERIEGKRFIINQGTEFVPRILARGFNESFGLWLSTLPAPKLLVWPAKFLHATVGMVYDSLGIRVEFDNTQSREVLGVTYRALGESVRDYGCALFLFGLAPSPKSFSLATSPWKPPFVDEFTPVPAMSLLARLKQLLF